MSIYTPIHRGTFQKGPAFSSMIGASLWIFAREDSSEWTVQEEGTAQAAAEMLKREGKS